MANVDVPICLRSSDGKRIAIDANCESVQLPVCMNATTGLLWVYHAYCDGVGESDGWYQVCRAAGGGLQITIPDDCCGELECARDSTCSGEGAEAISTFAVTYGGIEIFTCTYNNTVFSFDGDPGTCEAYLDPDVNNDGFVNVLDLIMVRNNMCKVGEDIYPPQVDQDEDGQVTANDYFSVYSRLGL